jgi:hypothetical protein
MGGIGLFKTIQRDGELAKIPWMFTSSPDREYGVLEAGCAYFLGKPFRAYPNNPAALKAISAQAK